jgi:hypothetical protein
MLARQFSIDKAPLVQPLMRAIFPRTRVDRKFLSANCVARALSASPNHVSAHGIKAHGVENFRIVPNLGHRMAILSNSATTQSYAPPRDRESLAPSRQQVDP